MGSTERGHFCHLPLLERFLIEDAPGWRIVISSSWRECVALDLLKQHFSPGIRERTHAR